MQSTNPKPFVVLFMSLILAVVLGACGGDTEAPEPVMEAENGAPMEEPTETISASPRLSLDESIALAKDDLIAAHDLSADQLSVVQSRPVTWRNGALGCPEPDMNYTQALVNGYYILLSDGDRRYAYHAGADGQPFACPLERSRPPAQAGTQDR